jgi:hypothetical protein
MTALPVQKHHLHSLIGRGFGPHLNAVTLVPDVDCHSTNLITF